MEKKYGTVIIDGKIIDLDKTSIEELKAIRDKLENYEREIMRKIDELLIK